MISVDQALRLVEQQVRPLASRQVPLGETTGLVLAEDVASDVNSPPHDKAMMDGYAVVAADSSSERHVVEEIAAGDVPTRPVSPGTASRIMTGAPLPEGADAVVPVEQTELLDNQTIRLTGVPLPAGKHVMRLGASLSVGQTVLRSGRVIRPIDCAVLAEVGYALVLARPRPRIAVLPTGNELVAAHERPAAGQIRDTNGPLLLAASALAGAVSVELGIGRDDRDDLRDRIERGLEADVLLLAGGVSAGKFDLVPAVLDELGVEQVFHKVALKPGKPLWFGRRVADDRTTLVFGLPGNPVSSFVCFELFVRPAIAALAGRGFSRPARRSARLAHDYEHTGDRATFLPARCTSAAAGRATDGQSPQWSFPEAEIADLSVELVPWQGSADLAALAGANCLVPFPAESTRREAGDVVEIWVF